MGFKAAVKARPAFGPDFGTSSIPRSNHLQTSSHQRNLKLVYSPNCLFLLRNRMSPSKSWMSRNTPVAGQRIVAFR